MAAQMAAQRMAVAKPTQAARCSRPRTVVASRSPMRALYLQQKMIVMAAAAEAEAVVEEVEDEEEDEEEEGPADSTWASEKLAALQAAQDNVHAEETQFTLNFMWLDKNIAVAVDQVFSRGHRSPITEYFFWPRKDAWEELKATLEAKEWIGEREKVLLLNKCTEVINYWQDDNKHSIKEAQEKFPDCMFLGS